MLCMNEMFDSQNNVLWQRTGRTRLARLMTHLALSVSLEKILDVLKTLGSLCLRGSLLTLHLRDHLVRCLVRLGDYESCH